MVHTGRLAELLDSLVKHFNDEELRTLCFGLDVDYDILPAQGKANKARETPSLPRESRPHPRPDRPLPTTTPACRVGRD